MKPTVIALATLLAAAAHGATIYETLGPNNEYYPSGSTIGGPSGQVVADLIYPPTGGKVGQITFALHHTSGENRYGLAFMTPGIDGPGDPVFYTKEFSITNGITTLAIDDGPTITAEQEFWLVVFGLGAGTQGAWWTSANHHLGTIAWRADDAGARSAAQTQWTVLGDQVLHGVRLSTESGDITATPEPSSALLAAPALLALGWLRRRQRCQP